MDAGVAAVLGAAVGAVGTGGAGVVTALLARSQTRLQLHAEYARLIREPRKAAYTAFAEALIRCQDTLNTADYHLTVANGNEPSDARSTLVREARKLYDSAQSQHDDLEHHYAQVVVEGPQEVTGAAIEASRDITNYQGEVLECLHELEAGKDRSPDEITLLKKKRGEAYSAYLRFLTAASRAIGVDGIAQKSGK